MVDTQSRHILILEVNLHGHRSIYLDKIVKAKLLLGFIVTVVVSEEYKTHPVINKFIHNYEGQFFVKTLRNIQFKNVLNSKLYDIGREIVLWCVFFNVFRKVHSEKSVDYVFIPYLDYCLNAIGLLGSPFAKVHWGGICMRPSFHYNSYAVIGANSSFQYIKQLLFVKLLNNSSLKGLYSIDELLVDYVNNRLHNLKQNLHYLPDPTELPLTYDPVELRCLYQIPKNAKVILVYGAIDERKGLFNLLDALEVYDELNVWHALIVGQQSEIVCKELSSERWSNLVLKKRIHIINEFVSDVVENQIFYLVDVVWVAYLFHYGMSGVIVRSGMYRKPVLASEEGLIGWYACNKKLGLTVVNKELSSIKVALISLSDTDIAYKLGNNGYSQFSSHTWSNFIEKLQRYTA